jgi:hypothetical protein
METRNSTNQITCEVGNKNQLEKQYMPSEAFHRTTDERVREITVRVRFEPLNLESFDPVTHHLHEYKLKQNIYTALAAFRQTFGERQQADRNCHQDGELHT